MSFYPESLKRLIQELSKLPSVGERSATRLAYHLISHDPAPAIALSRAILEAASSVKLCSRCYFWADSELCGICLDSGRDQSTICVIEKPNDVVAIEKAAEYRGLYHVLHGLWAPLRGKSTEDIKIAELVSRVKDNTIKEVIVATNSTVEGDATALYIAKLLAPFGIKISRPAQGMPRGAELEYADDVTLARALSARNLIG